MSAFRSAVAEKVRSAKDPADLAEVISQLIARIEYSSKLRDAVIALPEPTLGLKGGVSRAEVLRLIDEYILR